MIQGCLTSGGKAIINAQQKRLSYAYCGHCHEDWCAAAYAVGI
jgi:hypothetical protein